MNKAVVTLGVSALSLLAGALTGALAEQSHRVPQITRTPAPEVKYQPLDPGDKQGKGPQISMVFGDMKVKAPVGFLFKVPPGFRQGPHIHTQDYYSVVLQGVVHDFAPGADEGAAIGPGGHWFQAGKAPHDNHCASTESCVIFIYSPEGYDYIPIKAAAPTRTASNQK